MKADKLKKNKASIPFKFYTSLPLVELTGKKAKNLAELLEIIKTVDSSSIFYHTHAYVRKYLFLSNEYPSDFAYWVAELLQEKELGEKLALLDIRDFGSIQSLRIKLIKIIEEYLKTNPKIRDVSAGLEFHFCKTISLIMPANYGARTLGELKECLKKANMPIIYYHLMESKLHPQIKTNDLSCWLIENFNKQGLAGAINSINPCITTLEGTRNKIISLIEKEEYLERVRKRMEKYEPRTGIGNFLRKQEIFLEAKKRIREILWQNRGE